MPSRGGSTSLPKHVLKRWKLLRGKIAEDDKYWQDAVERNKKKKQIARVQSGPKTDNPFAILAEVVGIDSIKKASAESAVSSGGADSADSVDPATAGKKRIAESSNCGTGSQTLVEEKRDKPRRVITYIPRDPMHKKKRRRQEEL